MSDADDFAKCLFEEAKRFLEKARSETDREGKAAYLHAALMLGFGALEAHINAIADDFAGREDVPLLEQGLLGEREIELVNGEFRKSSRRRIYRLEERLQFICHKFAHKPLDRESEWWPKFKEGLSLRNGLAHPKEVPAISVRAVMEALNAIVSVLGELYSAVYHTDYPASGRGLDSTMTF